jgi:hypothetical protein
MDEQEAARLLYAYLRRSASTEIGAQNALRRHPAARGVPDQQAVRDHGSPANTGVSALVERRGRDSNPRSGGAGLRFSRPVHSTALPPLRETTTAPTIPYGETPRAGANRGRVAWPRWPSLHFDRPPQGEVAEWLKALAC